MGKLHNWSCRTVFRGSGSDLNDHGCDMFLCVHLFMSTMSKCSQLRPVDVIAPNLSFPLLSIPTCILIAINLFAHYYYVVTVRPGFVGDPLPEPGTGVLWAQKRRPLTNGVRWSSRGLRVTPAVFTRCLKCARTRPEVCKYDVLG